MTERICDVPHCGREHAARGMCMKHYYAEKRAGRLRNLSPRTTEERFWSKVDRGDPDGCWVWTGTHYDGYGRLFLRSYEPLVPAHRFSYELHRGPIPDGLDLDHLCRNRACVNPAHLEPVTKRVNTLRGEAPAAKNARKTHCAKGHEFDYTSPSGHRACRRCANERRRWVRSGRKATT